MISRAPVERMGGYILPGVRAFAHVANAAVYARRRDGDQAEFESAYSALSVTAGLAALRLRLRRIMPRSAPPVAKAAPK